MAAVSQTVTVIIDGVPTELDVDANLWGTGTVAARPVSGDAVGDIYIVQDSGQIRFDVWDGAAWVRGTVQGPSGGSVADRIATWDGTGGDVLKNTLVQVGASGHLDPVGAGQDIGPATAWRRLFTDHAVYGVDTFASTNTLDDARYVIAQNGTYTLTLPTAAAGWGYIIERQGSTGAVTLAPGGGDTINGGAAFILTDDVFYLVFAESATDWRAKQIGSTVGATAAIDFDSLFSSALASTGGTSFVDGFAGSSLSPPSDGDYEVIFSGEFSATNSNAQLEVGIALNSITTPVVDSERNLDPASAMDETTFYCDTVLTGLVTSDTIHGLFRKAAGSGSARIHRRRIKIQKVIQA